MPDNDCLGPLNTSGSAIPSIPIGIPIDARKAARAPAMLLIASQSELLDRAGAETSQWNLPRPDLNGGLRRAESQLEVSQEFI
jgi:hypothetical protein